MTYIYTPFLAPSGLVVEDNVTRLSLVETNPPTETLTGAFEVTCPVTVFDSIVAWRLYPVSYDLVIKPTARPLQCAFDNLSNYGQAHSGLVLVSDFVKIA